MLRTFTLTAALLVLQALLSSAHQDPPKVIRVHTMVIDMSQKEYTKLTRRSTKESDYEAAQVMVKKGKATISDVNCLTMRAGERGTLETNRELIYPLYETPNIDLPKQSEPAIIPAPALPNRPLFFVFETRNVGTTLEVEPTLDENNDIIDLRLSPEFVGPESYTVWTEGDDEFGKYAIKTPLFQTYRVNTGTTLHNGIFSLTHTFTGKDSEGKNDPNKKLLFFVMAEVIPVHRKQH